MNYFVILEVTLIKKSLVTNVYKVYSLPILHPILQKVFEYLLEEEYLAFSIDDDYAIIPSGHAILTCIFTKRHMCQLDTALYPTENLLGVFML